MEEREIGMRKLLAKCSIYHKEPRINDMIFDCGDRGTMHDKYTFCCDKLRPEFFSNCGPDFCFHAWPGANINSFEILRDEIIQAGIEPTRNRKIGWYGNIHSGDGSVPESYTRPRLHEIGMQNSEIMTIQHVSGNDIKPGNPNYMSIPDLVRNFSYLIDIGGNGYSGRLKFLLFSRRPILLIDRRYLEYFHTKLEPYVHYIPVKEDLSDLLDQIEWMFNEPEKTKQIAENAFEFAVQEFSMEKIMDRIYEVYTNLDAQGFIS